MNKKIESIILLIIMFFTITFYIYYKKELQNNNNFIITSNNNKATSESNGLALMIENGYNTHVYEESSNTTWPADTADYKYSMNTTKSGCENGGALTYSLTNKTVTMSGTNTDKCYVYFDRVYRLYSEILADNGGAAAISAKAAPNYNTTATTNEGMFAAPDDYGTSYFYRGTVTNNFVKFANMCWRVVRVTGNNATKLILYNYNPNNVDNPCDASQDGEFNAFAHNSSGTYTSAFNSTGTDNAYLGFMYGTVGATTYADAQANVNKSTILQFLENWYTTNLNSYSNYLADVIWCNDKTTTTGTKTVVLVSHTYTNHGYGGGIDNITLYGSVDRFTTSNTWGAGGSGPTLVCPNDNNGGKLSKFTVSDTTYGNGNLDYPIGLMTADELMSAGFIYGLGGNTSYYLYNNASGTTTYILLLSYSDWWCMTPLNFMTNAGSYYGVEWFSSSNGSWADTVGVSQTRGVRPMIAIDSASYLASGSGTSSDPYTIASK